VHEKRRWVADASLGRPGSAAGATNYLVSGIVVDSQSHAPLGNVRVSLAPGAARDRKLERVTQQDGRFSFAVSEPGKYVLSIGKPGYPLQLYKEAGFAPVSSAIVVRDDQDTTQLVFEANRGGAITGLIKDEDSEPVANALVAIYRSSVVDGSRKIFLRGQSVLTPLGNSVSPASREAITTFVRWASLVRRFGDPAPGNPEDCSIVRCNSARRKSHGAGADGAAGAGVLAGPGSSRDRVPDYVLSERAVDRTGFRDPAGRWRRSRCIHRVAGHKRGYCEGYHECPGEIGDGQVNLYSTFGEHRLLFMDAWVQPGKTFELRTCRGLVRDRCQLPGGFRRLQLERSRAAASRAADMEITLRPQQMGSLAGRIFFEGEHPAPGIACTCRSTTRRALFWNGSKSRRNVFVEPAAFRTV